MSLCKELKNLGAAACKNPMQIAKRLIFVPELGSSGDENKIATTAGVTKSALQALFNAASKSDRYYPTPLLENVENVRGEAKFYEFNSGNKALISKGIKHFVGYLPFEFAQLLEALESWEGQDFGIFIIDKDGNFIYQTDGSTRLEVKTFQVDGNSFTATEIESTDDEPIMYKIEFDYSVSAKDSLKRYIDAADLDFNGLSNSDVYALYTVTGTPASSAANTITVSLQTEYGEAVTGFTDSEISCIDDSGDAVTVSDVTESTGTPGTYTVTVSGLSGETDCYLQITKSKYDFAAVNALSVTVASS
jgi:hypothetical protein